MMSELSFILYENNLFILKVVNMYLNKTQFINGSFFFFLFFEISMEVIVFPLQLIPYCHYDSYE